MKVLGFVGSPRHRGNTDLLVERALKGASHAGASTRKFFLAHLDIHPCVACGECRKTGMCAVQDDMAVVRSEMEEAGGFVIGTPVYFWGPSAQLKAFVDRWYAFASRDPSFVNGKKASLICCFGSEDRTTARHVVGMFEDAFRYLKVRFVDKLLVTAGGKGDVLRDEAALKSAFELGSGLVM